MNQLEKSFRKTGGNRESHLQTVELVRQMHGADFFSRIGRKGGSSPHKSRPFATDRSLAKRAGIKGGSVKARDYKRNA